MFEIAYTAEAGAKEQHAINRLFELAQNGETGNDEFQQLEALVYGRLFQSYDHIAVAQLANVHVMVTAEAA